MALAQYAAEAIGCVKVIFFKYLFHPRLARRKTARVRAASLHPQAGYRIGDEAIDIRRRPPAGPGLAVEPDDVAPIEHTRAPAVHDLAGDLLVSPEQPQIRGIHSRKAVPGDRRVGDLIYPRRTHRDERRRHIRPGLRAHIQTGKLALRDHSLRVQNLGVQQFQYIVLRKSRGSQHPILPADLRLQGLNNPQHRPIGMKRVEAQPGQPHAPHDPDLLQNDGRVGHRPCLALRRNHVLAYRQALFIPQHASRIRYESHGLFQWHLYLS